MLESARDYCLNVLFIRALACSVQTLTNGPILAVTKFPPIQLSWNEKISTLAALTPPIATTLETFASCLTLDAGGSGSFLAETT